MKKIVVLLFFFCQAALAQEASLLGESADGKTVRLLWFFSTWDKNTKGFDIKRRMANGNWQTLNSSLIVPEISLTKSFLNVDPNTSENNRLHNKLQQWAAQKKVKLVSAARFLQILSSDDKAVQQLNIALALDYDLALVSGFALVDRSTTAGTTYEYGLFPVKTNNEESLVATFTWKAGTAAMLSPSVNVTARPYPVNNTIELQWTLDKEKTKDLAVAGYNIYKRVGPAWKKLNTTPIGGSNDQTSFTYFDNSSSASQLVNYAFSLQTMFGNEGSKVQYVYRPAEHPLTYKTPQLDDVATRGNTFVLNWIFPKEKEALLKGFVVAKANLPDTTKQRSALLPASQRSFTDNRFSPAGSYVQFSVKAVYNDGEEVPSNEQLAFYLPPLALPKPTHVTGQWIKEADKTWIALSWDLKPSTDSLTQRYHLYASSPADTSLSLQASGPDITENHLRFDVFNTKAATYKFKIVPVSKYNTEGPASDLLTVYAPATVLGIPALDSFSVDSSNRVSLYWKYGDTSGIKGFRLLQNGTEIVGADRLPKETQTFTTAPLQEDERYVFTLQAISAYGIQSPVSYPLNVSIYKRRK
jgi:hypothetical protein